jgi:phage terminase large subunit-like protein
VHDIKNRNYLKFIEDGDLTPIDGEVINIPKIQEIIMEDSKRFKFIDVFYDPWSATEMYTRLSSKGLNMTEFRMNTANLSEPTKRFQANIIEGTFCHNTKEMLEWCVANVVGKFDANGNVFPRKEHDSLKIDPIIAATMALAGWIADEEKESVYETRGIIIL